MKVPTPVTAFARHPKWPLLVSSSWGFRAGLGRLAQIIALATASMLHGAFAAIGQTNIKRLMAYSSIGHMGHALIGLAANTQAGVRGAAIYATTW